MEGGGSGLKKKSRKKKREEEKEEKLIFYGSFQHQYFYSINDSYLFLVNLNM